MRSWHPSLLLVLMSTVSGRIIDLSHKHGPTTFMVPGFEHYNRTLVKTLIFNKDVAVETAVYSSNEHGGTHMDAPLHFYKVGMTLDNIPLENTIAEGVMIDVSDEASKNIEYKVPLSKIHAWEKQNGEIPQKAAVIFNFGWHKKFHNKFEYINTVTDDWRQIKIPSVSEEVGNFLYDSRDIKIIGVDTMSPDPMNTGSAPIHIKYLANNKLIVENLNATDSLPPRGFRFHAAPVKYVGASGAQIRAYAIVHENQEPRTKNLVQMSTVSGRIIDLSHKHGPTTFMVPGFEHYNRTLERTIIFNKDVALETAVYFSNEHGGTHMDAPLHFYKDKTTLDNIPLENTIAEGVMIDVSDEASNNIEYKVPLEKIHAWEKQNGEIPQKAAVIFNFGWHKKFHNKFEYINTVTDDWRQIKIPSVSEEVGNFLYDSRDIKIIGVDTMSPDPMNTGSAPIHIKYLANNKLIVENLNATDSLPPRGFRFHAAPVKYVGASGAQIRAYAIVHENQEPRTKNQKNRSWIILPTWCLVIILLFSHLVILL